MAKQLTYKDVPQGMAKDITKPHLTKMLPCEITGRGQFIGNPNFWKKEEFETVEKPKGGG